MGGDIGNINEGKFLKRQIPNLHVIVFAVSFTIVHLQNWTVLMYIMNALILMCGLGSYRDYQVIDAYTRTYITRINEMHSVLCQRGFVFLVLLFMPDVIFSASS